MGDARSFVARLAMAGKGFKDIKHLTDLAFGDQTLKRTQIYTIMKTVREGGEILEDRRGGHREKKRTASLITEIADEVGSNAQVSLRALANAHGISTDTVQTILHDDLGLTKGKKAAKWVPKRLSKEQKEERVRVCCDFVAAVHCHSSSWLNNIVTMGEAMVSLHAPAETKKQSKKRVPKGQLVPTKAEVPATGSKQMVLAFFDAAGLIYSHIVPIGTTVNSTYTVRILRIFMKKMSEQRPQLVEQGFVFHRNIAPAPTAAVISEWLAANNIPQLDHPPCSPDLVPADFFLFPFMKEQLASCSLTTTDSVKTAWGGVVAKIPEEVFATAFRQWYARCEKCVKIDGNYLE